MQLIFVMYPVENVADAVAGYRALGFTDVWWPDADTALLGSAAWGQRVDIMLERHPTEARAGAGAVFRIDDVDAFYDAHPDLGWLQPPCDVPVGRYAIFWDPLGHPVRLLDLAYDDGAFARLLGGPQDDDRSVD